MAVEDYNAAQVALDAATRRAASAQARVGREAARVAELRRSLATVATTAYITGGADPLAQLVDARDPAQFLARAGMLQQLARGDAQRLLIVKLAVRRLDQQQVSAAQVLAEQHRLAREVAREKTAIERDVARQQVLLAKLITKEERRQAAIRAERARVAALRAARLAREAAARAAAARAAQRASRSRDASRTAYTGPASGRASVA
ncbi:MAG: hypothetical protein LC640_09485, partial [Frankia sp.]|nr:hypothetical protein [Frankia sp.]